LPIGVSVPQTSWSQENADDPWWNGGPPPSFAQMPLI
jgi:hypothetical protein